MQIESEVKQHRDWSRVRCSGEDGGWARCGGSGGSGRGVGVGDNAWKGSGVADQRVLASQLLLLREHKL